MIDGKNYFDKPIKNNKVTYENVIKIATGHGDDYRTTCLLLVMGMITEPLVY